MWFQVGVLLALVAFLMYVAAAFGSMLGPLLINGIILFLIVYRAYFEIRAGRTEQHAIGATAAFLLLLFVGNYGSPFWIITTFAVTSYVFSLIVQLVRNKAPAGRQQTVGRLAKA